MQSPARSVRPTSSFHSPPYSLHQGYTDPLSAPQSINLISTLRAFAPAFLFSWKGVPWSLCLPYSQPLCHRQNAISAEKLPTYGSESNYTPILHKRILPRAASFILFYFIYVFLGPPLQHVEVPRLVVELELQLPAYTTATAMPDLSSIFDLHHSSRQCQILSPLSEARDQMLTDASQVHYC